MSNFKEFWGLRCFIVILSLVSAIDDANAILPPFQNRTKHHIPAIFNFGDSNSDTGSFSAAFARVSYPNGVTFFGNSSGRHCDGRLIIDFIAEKLSLPYISAYLDAMQTGFKHGANFASSGTTIMPVDGKYYGYGINPVSLNIQLLQFLQFKERVDELHKRDKTSAIFENRLPKPEDFSTALYTFDIGQNDINMLYALSKDQAYTSLPGIVDSFALSIEQLHQLGARYFLIHNTGPQGCLPVSSEMYPSDVKDEIGCSKSLNKVAQEFNLLLKAKISLLHSELQNSSITYVDMYSTKYSLIRDAKLYGYLHPFDYCYVESSKFTTPFWNMTVADPIEVFAVCGDPSKYISWDGTHYTEAANRWIANNIFDSYIGGHLVNLSVNRIHE